MHTSDTCQSSGMARIDRYSGNVETIVSLHGKADQVAMVAESDGSGWEKGDTGLGASSTF